MSRIAHTMAFVVILLACSLVPVSSSVARNEAPFIILDPDFLPIPKGKGMMYFFGIWDNGSGPGPLMITPDEFIYYETRESNLDTPYRVVYEAENYVLIVRYLTFTSGRQWTEFVVLTLLMASPSGNRNPKYAQLRWFPCIEDSVDQETMHNASQEFLLAAFKQGCLEGIDQTSTEWSKTFKFSHWSGSRRFGRQ